MFKVDEAGVPVEVWPPIELTQEDRAVIAEDIAAHTNLHKMKKVNGVWKQCSALATMEAGYRIYGYEEEERLLDFMNRWVKYQIPE